MQALKVGHFRRVAGFDQGLKTCFDEFHRTAAQHSLFAEQVGFCFFAEVGFNDAGFAATVGHRVAHRQFFGFTRIVFVDRNQVGHAAALGVGTAHRVARSLRRNHPHVQVSTWVDQAVMHVETVGKHQ